VTPAPYETVARNLATESENRIHADDVARELGFGGGLVPGVELFAYAAHPFVAAWGVDFLTSGRLSVRFRRPVYDGDTVSVVAEPAGTDAFTVTLRGADGEARAVGSAEAPGDVVTARRDYAEHPAPDRLLPTGPGRLPTGPLGSVVEDVSREAHEDYLAGIGETEPLYRERGLCHPGGLLRVVNALLMRNVALGPWIHTASDCRFLGPAPVPGVLRCHGLVTECFERNGNAYVRYDALVVGDDGPAAEVDHTAIYRLAAAPG
jgi:acyl dehydratase